MKDYPRFLKPNFEPFDPIILAKETEKIVTRVGKEGLKRKYVAIYSAPVYRGIATAYAVGCCLRCLYCWTNWSRDFPEKFGKFYSPKEVAQKLLEAAERGIVSPGWERFRHLKIEKLRLSGCEPTLARDHLLAVLKYAKDSKYRLFILETNGLLLGADRDYVRQLAEFREKLYVRVSFKAATAKDFTLRTGALGKYYELPFKALEYLLTEGIDARAAAMSDPRIMSKEERNILIKRLNEIDSQANYFKNLEEESFDGYETTIKRLKAYSDSEFAKKLEKEIGTKN